MTEKQIVASWF